MSDPVSPANSSRPRRPLRVLTALFLGGLAFAGGGAATCVYRVLTREPRKPAPTVTTVLRDTSTIVVAMRDMATLETASYHIERVVDLRDRQSRFFGMVESEDAILLVAAGDVTAGVDLTTMRDGDVSFDPKREVAYVMLPKATVLAARIDNGRTYVHTRKTDALAERAETLETRARQEAERSLREAALSAGILDRASKNAAHTIESLVRGLGFKRVEIRFREE